MSEKEIYGSQIKSEHYNRPKGCIPPISKAEISYDEGGVKIYVYNGREGDTDDDNILHININAIGAVEKYKGWKIYETHQMGDGLIYIHLEKRGNEK